MVARQQRGCKERTWERIRGQLGAHNSNHSLVLCWQTGGRRSLHIVASKTGAAEMHGMVQRSMSAGG